MELLLVSFKYDDGIAVMQEMYAEVSWCVLLSSGSAKQKQSMCVCAHRWCVARDKAKMSKC